MVRGAPVDSIDLTIVDSMAMSVAFSAVVAGALFTAWRTWRQPYLAYWAAFWALYVPVWALYGLEQAQALAPASLLGLTARAGMTTASLLARSLMAFGIFAYLGRPVPAGRWRWVALAIAVLTSGSVALQAVGATAHLPGWATLPFRTYFVGLFLDAFLAVVLLRDRGGTASAARRLLGLAVVAGGASDAWDVLLQVSVGDPWTETGLVLRLSNLVAHVCDALFATGCMVAAIGTEHERAERAAAALRDRDARLQETQRLEMLGRLAGGLAHDFNNLLTAILAHLAFARDALPSGSEVRQDVETAAGAAERGSRLTRQLLTFARQQATAPQLLDLGDLVVGLDRLALPLLGERIERRLRVAPALWPVRADPTQLEQLLLNLIVNARDAMPEGGALTVEVSNVTAGARGLPDAPELPAGDWVRLAVGDSGHGMDEATRRRIFEPFFTTKPHGQGSGLGLATVQAIVQQAGGHLAVESAPGAGARFLIFLPRQPGAVAAAAPEGVAAPRGHETILLVEDEPSLRAAAVRVLEGAGYTVLATPEGSAALRLPEEALRGVSLLVTDVVMPGMDGTALARELRARRPELPVLFVSGYAPPLLEAGAVEAPLLSKPYAPEQLLVRVRGLLDA
jgi:signal transduction histidine kinase